MSFRLFLFLLLMLGQPILVQAQSVYLPTTHEVYDFLKRVEARGLLSEYRDAAKPLSRMEIALHLRSLDSSLDKLTPLERSTYEYLKSEFSYEFGALAGDPQPTDLRWHLLSADLNEGVINLDLNGKLQWDQSKGDKVRLRSQGLRFYGYVFKTVGYSFNFVDSREVGNAINFNKVHTPDPGIIPTKSLAEELEYNTTEAQLTWQVGRFNFSLEKMQNVWGYGERGNVILSRKSPSYPQFKLRVPLSSWMDFVYILAQLHSNVVDSTQSYPANSSGIINFYRTVYREKYLAAHFVEFTIVNGLDLSLGESAIYSDKGIQLIYLIPVMFFKSGEHYNRDTDNIQWFGALDVNLIPKVNFNFSVLIDELNADDLLRPGSARNQLGYTAGIHTYDLAIENTELILEYSRLNPWIYSHKYPAATFTNDGFDMGHWIGQNADDLYLEVRYRPVRSVKAGVFAEVYRKGGLKDVAFQYMTPSQPFLYGPLRTERTVGVYGDVQVTRDLFINGIVRSHTVTDEAIPSLDRTKRLEFTLALSYGIW